MWRRIAASLFEPVDKHGLYVTIFLRAEIFFHDSREKCEVKPAKSYSAASNVSAPPRSTDTSRLTPRSTIVTPNSRCIRLIVAALCVTIR